MHFDIEIKKFKKIFKEVSYISDNSEIFGPKNFCLLLLFNKPY